jgi:DNA-binding transcriptional ArsR family regulator
MMPALDDASLVRVYLPLVSTYVRDGVSALGDPTRRAVFELLADGPRPVGDLARQLPVTRPAVSQHLKVLKDAGLVTDRQVGTRRLYQLNPSGVGALRAYFDGFWNRALAAFKDVVEQRNEEHR